MRPTSGGLRLRHLVPVAIAAFAVAFAPSAGAVGPPKEKPQANVTITKEVCSTGTGCDTGAAIGEGGWDSAALVETGTTIDWRITVTNTGTDILIGVSVDDPNVPSCSRATADLPAFAHFGIGESISYTCSSGAISAALTNTATVSAVGCTCGKAVSAADSAAVTITTSTTTTVPGSTTTEGPTTTVEATTTTAEPTTTSEPEEVLGASTLPPAEQPQVEDRNLAVTGQSIVQQLGIAATLLVVGGAALAAIRRRSVG